MSDAAATLDANATVKAVPVSAKREVCYEFDTKATDAGLAIPYLVSINGKIQSKLGKLDGTRKIKRMVDIGSKVALYLNSDVHPDHRSTPVYAVEVGNNNVLIKITEKTGHHADLRPVIGQPLTSGSQGWDCYQAPLTGNIWMAISHRYSENEAQKCLAADTPIEVRQAKRPAIATILISFDAEGNVTGGDNDLRGFTGRLSFNDLIMLSRPITRRPSPMRFRI